MPVAGIVGGRAVVECVVRHQAVFVRGKLGIHKAGDLFGGKDLIHKNYLVYHAVDYLAVIGLFPVSADIEMLVGNIFQSARRRARPAILYTVDITYHCLAVISHG